MPPRSLCVFALIAALLLPAGVGWADLEGESDAEMEERVAVARVRSLRWKGNDALSSRVLRDHILTEGPSWIPWRARPSFSEQELRRDMDRIVALYQSRGYYEARARHSVDWLDDGTVAIEIRLEEGSPVILRELAIDLPDSLFARREDGESLPTREDYIRDLPLREGEVFSLDPYRMSRDMLVERLAEAGFPDARISGGAEVEVPTHEAVVSWTIRTGPRVRFGGVSVTGLTDVSEHIVRREVAFDAGEYYSLSALERTRRRLQNLGLFRWVLVQPSHRGGRTGSPTEEEAESGQGGEGTEESEGRQEVETEKGSVEEVWDIDVRLKERPPRSVQIGAGWGTDEGFRAKFSWHHRNFLGDGRRVDFFTRYSERLSYIRPRFMQPRLFGFATKLRFAPGIAWEDEPAYEAARVLVDTDLSHPLPGPWWMRGGYHFGWNDVTQKEPDFLEPDGIFIMSGPFIGIRRSTVLDPVDARKGTWLDLSIESSFKEFGATASFLRYTAEGRAFHPIWKTVGAVKLKLAAIQTISGSKPVDISSVERLYSGGSNAQRGFGYRKLSPLNDNDDPIGGSSLIEAMFELRFPIWRKFGGVAFVDAANVSDKEFDFTLKNLRYASGFGLRYDTPVGPLRIDFAWRLNDPGAGRFQVSASVGQSF